MTDVYVLIKVDWEETEIHGVFLSFDRAKAACAVEWSDVTSARSTWEPGGSGANVVARGGRPRVDYVIERYTVDAR